MADIQTLINAIPDAQDGFVITADYEVTIKAALQAIAGQLGAVGSQTVSLTLSPTFLPIAGATPWGITFSSAADAGPPSTNGWLPLYLPDGAIIQKLLVTAVRANPALKGFVSLVIVPIGMTSGTTLILVDLGAATSSPSTLPPGTPNVPGVTTIALQDLQTVDNSQFKYLIQAQVFSSTGILAGSLTIFGLQVVYAVTK